MNTNKKMADLARRKAMLESKIQKVKESKKTSLAYLIESELEKAEVLLVAKSVVEKLQKVAEEIAKIEGSDIMPAMEGLKAAYGPQLADQFQATASEQLRATVAAITGAKDALSASVAKFEGVLNGEQPGNDMAAEMPAPEMDADMDADLEVDGDDDLGDMADIDVPAPAEDDAALDDLDADFAPDAEPTTAAGRTKKESVAPRGKRLSETEASSKPNGPLLHQGDRVKTNYGKSGKIITISGLTATVEFDGEARPEKIDCRDLALVTNEKFVKGKKGVNPFAKKDEKKCDKDDKDCEKVEESTDAKILAAFRNKLREGSRPVPAAKAVAEAFAVDLQDVVAIISDTRGK